MSSPLRVLIVEDSEDDAILLVRELRKGGYEPDFLRVDDAGALRDSLELAQWDLVIADHNMPGFSSDAALDTLKRSGLDISFIIVSGSIGEDYAVAAMKAGAHDYLMKGNLSRLVPAVDRELREAEMRQAHRQAEEAIRHMAYHDELTDLYNRREFERAIRCALDSAREQGQVHVLFYMDLDQFKLINDTCGHAAGDDLLRSLSILFRTHVREGDVVARLGGDEFGVLLHQCPTDRAVQIAEGLRQAVAGHQFIWHERPFHVGISVGVVEINSASRGVDGLLSTADMACYAAKDLGRNRVHVYAEGDLDLARRHGDMQWVSRIRKALDEDRLLLYMQPMVHLQSRRPPNTEFLLRMRDEGDHVIGPGAFIPAAEHYNLMPLIDRWVVRNALAYVAGDAAATDGLSFINLSGCSLNDDSFIDFVLTELRSHGVPGDRICFEITETAAIANLSRAVGFVNEVRRCGCRFALDDFVSGLSSFTYLKTLPVDFLKIDGSFVRDMVDDPMDDAIVEAINKIGHAAGIETVAEFVENDAIKARLISKGVDYAQGYGIEAPHSLYRGGEVRQTPGRGRLRLRPAAPLRSR